MMKRKNKNKSIIFRVLILGLCVYMIATLLSLWGTLNQSRQKLKSLQAEYATEQNDIEELREILKDDSNTQIIEKAARERLGYIYSDEQVFLDISGNWFNLRRKFGFYGANCWTNCRRQNYRDY